MNWNNSKAICHKVVVLTALAMFVVMSISCEKDKNTEHDAPNNNIPAGLEYESDKQTVTEQYGTIKYDKDMGCWFIYVVVSNTYDSVIYYYPASLDAKLKKEDIKVLFSGESAKMKKQAPIGGIEYYVVFITDIKVFDQGTLWLTGVSYGVIQKIWTK